MSLIHARYRSDAFVNAFRAAFESKEIEFFDKETGAMVVHTPFTVALLPGIVADSTLVSLVREELLHDFRHSLTKQEDTRDDQSENFLNANSSLADSLDKDDKKLAVPFTHKWNDLHDFYQSPDLALLRTKGPELTRLLEGLLLNADWPTHMQRLTGVDVSGQPDISAQVYTQGSRLLCHDDALEGRRIAFILYLVEAGWDGVLDGGTLDLYDMDMAGWPRQIIRSIVPEEGALAFFEVTPASHHQVAEVIAASRQRLAITGWLHGPSPHYDKQHFIKKLGKSYASAWHQTSAWPYQIRLADPGVDLAPFLQLPSQSRDFSTLKDVVHPQYLKAHMRDAIRHCFIEGEPVSLLAYLVPSTFQSLKARLLDPLKPPVPWMPLGPPSWRSFSCCPDMASLIPLFRDIFLSPLHVAFWADLTHISLDSSRLANLILTANVSFLRFQPGSYLLLHDTFAEQEQEKYGHGIDAYFFILPEKHSQEDGQFCIAYQDSLPSSPQNKANETGMSASLEQTAADQVTLVDPTNNMLLLVRRHPSVQLSISYLKRTSPEFYCIHFKLSSAYA
jgi:hypothetical protein